MSAKDDILTQIRDCRSGDSIAVCDMLARLCPPQPDVSSISVTCRPGNYSAAVIARAVEDCDAHLLNLNVTADRTPDGDLVIDLRVNRANPDTVARSLARYGYDAIDAHGHMSPEMETLARDRMNELIHYLEI